MNANRVGVTQHLTQQSIFSFFLRVYRLTTENKEFTSHFPLESALVPGNLSKDGEIAGSCKFVYDH